MNVIVHLRTLDDGREVVVSVTLWMVNVTKRHHSPKENRATTVILRVLRDRVTLDLW